MLISNEDRAAIATAIGAAEAKTSGQIVCVLVRSASEYYYVPVLWAALLSLVAPWPLIAFTAWSVQRIFLSQIVVFAVAVAILAWLPLRIALVPASVRRARAHRAAVEQFMARGLTLTRDRTGVLIFVALAEHYARIIADEGISRHVNNREWQEAVDALIAHIREGRIAEGFIVAIEKCGAVLAKHAPPSGRGNELPDRIYVL
jgi:putative membrane protein